MTCREKLKQQYPGHNYVNDIYTGGCLGCPNQYGYLPAPEDCDKSAPYMEAKCRKCWDREIPEKNKEEV